jgi:hypothetical protein
MALDGAAVVILVLVIIMFFVAIGCIINTIRTRSSYSVAKPQSGPDRAGLCPEAKVWLPGNKRGVVQRYFPSTDRVKITLTDTGATTTVDASMVGILEAPGDAPRPVVAQTTPNVCPQADLVEPQVHVVAEYSAPFPVDEEIRALWANVANYEGYVQYGVAAFIEPEVVSYSIQVMSGTNHKVQVRHLLGVHVVTIFTPPPFMDLQVPPQITDVMSAGRYRENTL